jgi:hypothetical protein
MMRIYNPGSHKKAIPLYQPRGLLKHKDASVENNTRQYEKYL